jgi:membrane protein DedA with SNARE-associated domain
MPASMDVSDFVGMLVEAGPIGIVAVALAEKFFPVVPSYVVFVLLGMTVASGQGDLAVTVAATVTGSTIGAFGWYCLGLALGPRQVEALIERFGRFVFLKPALYHRMTGAYRSHHFWVTVVGQTIPAVRIYPAGVLHLAIANFLTATLIPLLQLALKLLGALPVDAAGRAPVHHAPRQFAMEWASANSRLRPA